MVQREINVEDFMRDAENLDDKDWKREHGYEMSYTDQQNWQQAKAVAKRMRKIHNILKEITKWKGCIFVDAEAYIIWRMTELVDEPDSTGDKPISSLNYRRFGMSTSCKANALPNDAQLIEVLNAETVKPIINELIN